MAKVTQENILNFSIIDVSGKDGIRHMVRDPFPKVLINHTIILT